MKLLKPLGEITPELRDRILNFRRMKSTFSPSVWDLEFFHARSELPFYGYVEVQCEDARPFYMLTNADDVIAEFFLWYGRNSYERTTIREWVRHVKNSNVIFDIGANTGIFSLLGCSASDAPKQVVAFEPTLRACARVYENANVNGFTSNIKVEKLALSDQEGVIEFMNYEGTHRISSGASYVEGANHLPVQSRELCERIRLDSYIEKTGISPDLIKMDVEGAEIDVVNGARNVISRRSTKFIIEVVPTTVDVVVSAFDGYSVHVLDDNLGRAVPYTGGVTHHINLLFEPS